MPRTGPLLKASGGLNVTWEVLSAAMKDLIVLSDPRGVIFYASPASRLLGYEPHELIGLSAADLVHSDDRARFSAETRALFEPDGVERSGARTHRYRRKDGSFVWLEGHPSLLPSGPGGPPAGVLDVLRDVTGRSADQAGS